MESIEEFYSDIIMENSISTKNRRNLGNGACSLLGHNPSCGDKISVSAIVENGIIVDLAFDGTGCAISQSSTNIMIDLLKGKTTTQAKQLISTFLKMIKREQLSKEELSSLKNARIFQGVANMPTRAKCATLAWHTLEDLLTNNNKK